MAKNDDIIGLVREKYDLRRKKSQLESQWKLNELFYRGRQNYDMQRLDPSNYSIIEADDQDYETGIVANMLFQTLNNIKASVLKNNPTFFAVPGTSDRSDRTKAKYTNKMVEYVRQKISFLRISHSIVLKVLLYGTCFGKVVWDKMAGDMVENLETSYKTNKETGDMEEVKKITTEYPGDVCVFAVSPFNVLVNPQATDLDDARWLLHYYVKHLDEVKFKYPKIKDLEGESGAYEEIMTGGLHSMSEFDKRSETEKSIVIKELYLKPCLDYPDGLYAKVAGNVLLESSDLLPEDWPWVKFDSYENPDEFWCEALSTQLNPIQQQINMHLDQMLSYTHSVINSPILNPMSSGVTNAQITNSQNQVWSVTSLENSPARLSPSPLPSDMFATFDTLMRVFEEVSRISRPSKGQNVPGGRSALTIQYLQEADQLNLIPLAVQLEGGFLELMKIILKLIKNNYTEDRMITVVGNNRSTWVKPFKSDLVIDRDLRVQMYSSLPQSVAATQQFIMDMTQAQILNPVEDKSLILETLNMPSLDNFYSDVLVDEEEAEWENDLLMQGQFPPVKQWQNHQKHLEEHLILLKSQEFREIGNNPAQVQGQNGQVTIEQVATQHITDHQNAQAEIEDSMLERQLSIQAKVQQSMAPPEGGM